MRLTGASEIAPDSKDPKTHKIGFIEIGQLAKAWRDVKRGDVRSAERRLYDVLESIDPRWVNFS